MAVIFKMALDLTTLRENSVNRPSEMNPDVTIWWGQDILFQNPTDAADRFFRWHEERGIPIRDGLSGLRGLKGFGYSSQLEFAIHQIHSFVASKEDWTFSKKNYRKIERNFSITLHNVITVAYKNLVFNLGVKPPVSREHYKLLKSILEFQPFWDKWAQKQQNRIKKYMSRMELYFEHFNKLEDDVLRKMIDQHDCLLKRKRKH